MLGKSIRHMWVNQTWKKLQKHGIRTRLNGKEQNQPLNRSAMWKI